VNPPVVKPIGSSIFIVYPEPLSITLEFARIVDHKDTLKAEVTVTSEVGGELAWASVNLLSVQGRNTIAKAAEERTSPDVPWKILIEESCRAVARHLRTADPALITMPAAPNGHRFLVPDLIPLNNVTVLYADGDTGKSLLAAAIIVAGLQGHPLSRKWPVGDIKRALYLDWEDRIETLNARLWGLTRGREDIPDAARPIYRRLARPLAEHVDPVRADIDRYGIDFVVVDSLAPASGFEQGDPAAATIKLYEALGRLMPATILVLAHVTKADEDGKSRLYGSAFNRNLARSVIEARRQEAVSEDKRVVVNLYHRKANNGVRAAASALAFDFSDPGGGIAVSGAEVDMARSGLPDRIIALLRYGSRRVSDLADETSESTDNVRRTLLRLEKAGKAKRLLDAAVEGSKHNSLWGLPDTAHGS
jgi:hypothetical protein